MAIDTKTHRSKILLLSQPAEDGMGRRLYKKLVEAGLEELRQDRHLVREEYLQLDDGDWDYDDIAERFTLIADSPRSHPELAKAFLEAKLNPNDPFNWQYVLEVFVNAHFQVGRSGAKKKKTRSWDKRFKTEYLAIADKDAKTIMDKCKKLKETFPDRYGQSSIGALRRDVSRLKLGRLRGTSKKSMSKIQKRAPASKHANEKL